MEYGDYDFSLFLVVEGGHDAMEGCCLGAAVVPIELYRQLVPISGEVVDWYQNFAATLVASLGALPCLNVPHAKFLDIHLHIHGEGYVYGVPPLCIEADLQCLLIEQEVGVRVFLSR